MRFELFSVFAILLLVGSNDARPPKIASPEVVEEESTMTSVVIKNDDDSSWRPVESTISPAVPSQTSGKSVEDRQVTKNHRSIDESLMTVATQLLNVTNLDEATTSNDKSKNSNDISSTNVLLLRKPLIHESPIVVVDRPDDNEKTKNDVDLIREINSEIKSLESMGIGFGRPTNSKFGYFESSHPGEAMAMTEEELEREMRTSTTRFSSSTNNQPTTTGGLSTWILLNSPTTTVEPSKIHENEKSDESVNVEIKLQTPSTLKNFEPTFTKTDSKIVRPHAEIGMADTTTTPMEKIVTMEKSTTSTARRTTSAPARLATTTEKSATTTRRTKTTDHAIVTNFASTIDGSTRNDVKITTPIVTTKKSVTTGRPFVKTTTPKSANVTSRPMTTKLNRTNQSTKTKNNSSRKSASKPIVPTTTTPTMMKNGNFSKIEKVTFRPIQMITTPKSIVEIVERPIFVTKMKTSLVANANTKTSTPSRSPIIRNDLEHSNIKPNTSETDPLEIPSKSKPQPIRTNNVSKVHPKKPIDSSITIEVTPIKVNPPILKIEKIANTEKIEKKNSSMTNDPMTLTDSKFDVNSESTGMKVETSTIMSSSTTKRSHKRKKNKTRRRKPNVSTSTTIVATSTTQSQPTTTTSPITTTTDTTDEEDALDILTELGITDNALQESKIIPESAITSNTTKNKKKQPQKPIGTQLYNFLSREVMPSFGVMSLVGLGLGLASYFLYPFGGSIARRNYVVEPNYQYNPDEYGGNYGQNEEEVFSKVVQGMTNTDANRYNPVNDYTKNYQRLHRYDGPYGNSPTTLKEDSRYSTSLSQGHRNRETTINDDKYGITDFKYPELPTTTNYHRESVNYDYSSKKSVPSDRQFVVGNVPKEYGSISGKRENFAPFTGQVANSNYHSKILENHKFADDSMKNLANGDSRPEALALRSNEGYEDVEEIAPSAVAVEHGPRLLDGEILKIRRKRDSVIQMIPSRSEIEMEEKEIEKEEPLSNEIIDIIDSVIPDDRMTLNDPAGVAKVVETKDGSNDRRTDQTMKIDVNDESRQILESGNLTKNSTKAAILTSTMAPDNLTTLGTKIVDQVGVTTTLGSNLNDTEVPELTINEILGATTNSGVKDGDEKDGVTPFVEHTTTDKPQNKPFNIFSFVKKIAEVKLKLGIAILKHASEGFARYLGHVQKRVNGEE